MTKETDHTIKMLDRREAELFRKMTALAKAVDLQHRRIFRLEFEMEWLQRELKSVQEVRENIKRQLGEIPP